MGWTRRAASLAIALVLWSSTNLGTDAQQMSTHPSVKPLLVNDNDYHHTQDSRNSSTQDTTFYNLSAVEEKTATTRIPSQKPAPPYSQPSRPPATLVTSSTNDTGTDSAGPGCALWSCKDKCEYKSRMSPPPQSCVSCYCDPLCVVAGDCCMDYFSLCHNLSHPDLTAQHIRHLLLDTSSLPTPDHTDLPTHLLSRYGQCTPSGWKSFIAVSACPAHFPDLSTKSQCDNSSVLVPVSHLHHPTLVFRNVFCAQCHGFEPNVTQKWILTLKCKGLKSDNPSVVDIMKAFRNNRCGQVYQPPDKNQTSFETFPALCSLWTYEFGRQMPAWLYNVCTEDDYLFCSTFNFPTTVKSPNSSLSKNSYCLKCQIDDVLSNSCTSCSITDAEGSSMLVNRPRIGISKLFYFSSDGAQVTINGQTVAWPGFYCGTDEVYDHHDKMCQKLTCSKGYQLKDWKCVPVSILVDGHTQLQANGSHFFSILLLFAENVSKESMMKFGRQMVKILSKAPFMRSVVPVFHSSDNQTAKVSMNVTGFLNFREVYKHIPGLHKRISAGSHKEVTITVSNVRDQLDNINTTCPDGTLPLTVTNLNVTEKKGELFVVVTSQGGKQLYPLKHIPFNMTFLFSDRDEENVPTVTTAVICEQSISNSSLTCPALEHLRNETSIVNGSLVIHSSGLVFGEEEYEVDGDKVRVCSRYKNINSLWDKLTLFNFDPAQKKVMYVLSTVSVLSLVFVLCIYCLLPELRTLPGKFVMSVVVSLIAGHLTLMIDVDDATTCRVIGVLSHFVWLTCFTWMSAIAVHMARTFTCMSSGLTTAAEARRTWFIYSLVCWGLPLVVVVLCVTLDAIPSVGFSMDYGVKSCGWIGNGKANLWTFMIPVAISMAVNLSAFVSTVIGIERTTRVSSMVSSQRSERKRLLVYVKLSAALGFTWILGLVAAFASYTWLQWLHLAVNSLQGTFLALVYVLNERVVHMLKKRVSVVFKQQLSTISWTQTSFTSMSCTPQK